MVLARVKRPTQLVANDIVQTLYNTSRAPLDNTGKCKIWKSQTGIHTLSDLSAKLVTPEFW
jgi:hypothetical protein